MVNTILLLLLAIVVIFENPNLFFSTASTEATEQAFDAHSAVASISNA